MSPRDGRAPCHSQQARPQPTPAAEGCLGERCTHQKTPMAPVREAGSNSSQAKIVHSCFHAPQGDPRPPWGVATCMAIAGKCCPQYKSPMQRAALGQNQGKVMQSQAGNEIRSVSAAGEALQAIPRLRLGGWHSRKHRDTASSLRHFP